jgi:Flp pilus assembly pilin Flp
MRSLMARIHSWWLRGDDAGQATTEYALVMLGAALIALLVVAWATGGGGAGKIGRLFDSVIDAVTSKI